MHNKKFLSLMTAALAMSMSAGLAVSPVVTPLSMVAYADTTTEDSIVTPTTHTGSVTVNRVNSEGKKVAGSQFWFYKVMSITPGTEAGDYADFKLTDNFENAYSDSELQKWFKTADALKNLSARDLQAMTLKLDAYVNANGITPDYQSKGTNGDALTQEDGVAVVENMQLGWYLVVETTTADKEIAVRPFMVAVPSTNNASSVEEGADMIDDQGNILETYFDESGQRYYLKGGKYYYATGDKKDTELTDPDAIAKLYKKSGTEWDYSIVVNPKAPSITVDKKIINGNNVEENDPDYDGTGEINYDGLKDTVAEGDYVHYEVRSSIPSYADSYFEDGATSVYTLTDYTSDGLTIIDEYDDLKYYVNGSKDADGNAAGKESTNKKRYAIEIKYVSGTDDKGNEILTEIPLTETVTSGETSTTVANYAITLTPTQGNTTDKDVAKTEEVNGHLTWAQPDLKIEFTKDFLKNTNYRGKTLVVTYWALVNEDAIMGTRGNTNDVYLEYSHNPHDTTSADRKESPEEDKPDTHVYLFGIQIDKFYTDDNGTQKALAGAQFKLYHDINLTEAVKYDRDYKSDNNAGEEGSNTEYKKYMSADTNGDLIITTDENGNAVFPRLDAGTYWIKEVKSPAGYTLLTNPIKVEIIPHLESSDGKKVADGGYDLKIDDVDVTASTTAPDKYASYYIQTTETETVTVDETTTTITKYTTDGITHIAVENYEGFALPATGGRGILLTLTIAAGGILVITAMLMKSRGKKETQTA